MVTSGYKFTDLYMRHSASIKYRLLIISLCYAPEKMLVNPNKSSN